MSNKSYNSDSSDFTHFLRSLLRNVHFRRKEAYPHP